MMGAATYWDACCVANIQTNKSLIEDRALQFSGKATELDSLQLTHLYVCVLMNNLVAHLIESLSGARFLRTKQASFLRFFDHPAH